MSARVVRWPLSACLLAVMLPNLPAQRGTLAGDVAGVRESLRRTHSSGAWFKENAAKRLPDWTARAGKGSAEAMWFLGRCYLDGYGGAVPDNEKAVGLITKSAEKGFGLAQNGLGYAYENGDGVEKDVGKAVGWYRKAAEQGEPAGCHNLARIYENGIGVDASVSDALRWYERAAGTGYRPAIRRLAAVYEFGAGGVKPSADEVVKWYRKLGEAGDPKGTAKVVLLYEQGKAVPKNAAEAGRYRERLKEQAGDEAEDYLLLVDLLADPAGKKVPNAKGVIDGKPFRLSDQAGKVVVLRFGASWCGHCRVLTPRLEALSKKYGAKTFAVVDIDVDRNPTLSELWEVESVPQVFVIDHTGVIRETGCRGDDLDRAVADLVAGAMKKGK